MFRYFFLFLQSSRYVSNEQSCLKATGLYDNLLFLSNFLHIFYFIFNAPTSFSLCFRVSPSLLILFSVFFLKPLSSVCHAVLSHSVISDSLWPRGLQLPRFLCPWGFSRHERAALPSSRISSQPGIKLRSPRLQSDSLPTEPLGRTRILKWVAYPFSRVSFWPKNHTRSHAL